MDIFNLTNSNEILSRRRTQDPFNVTMRRGLLLDDAAAEQHQQHHRAARHPLRRSGDLVTRAMLNAGLLNDQNERIGATEVEI